MAQAGWEKAGGDRGAGVRVATLRQHARASSMHAPTAVRSRAAVQAWVGARHLTLPLLHRSGPRLRVLLSARVGTPWADLIKAHNGLKANGVYLVRKGADELQLILSVSFKGKFVHNALTRTDAGSAFQLNGKDTKLVDLDEVLKLLAKKSKALMWPVALTSLVPVQRAQGDGGGITSLPFYHGELAAGDAADICAGKNGNFLLRHDPSHPPLDFVRCARSCSVLLALAPQC